MKVGTKSVLFGAHCFFIHPWFVAWAWWRLYGFPFDPRLWVAFFVHDLGYWGMPNMDGEEGERHPHFGAEIMGWLFDKPYCNWRACGPYRHIACRDWPRRFEADAGSWYCFTFYHSRFLSKLYGHRPTKLCIADKLAIVLTPTWLYVPLVTLTGEVHEYRRDAAKNNRGIGAEYATSHYEWYEAVKAYVAKWVEEHKDGRDDTWTSARTARDENGVWS